jgi:hypothetical protein
LESYVKGDFARDIDSTVLIKVRVGLLGVMIEGYQGLAELLVKAGRANEANSAYDTANR